MEASRLLGFIENSLDWYDHVAFHFLTCPDASAALSDVEQLISQRGNDASDRWRRLLVAGWFRNHDPLEAADRGALNDALYLLRQWKVLRVLGVELSSVSLRSTDPFRLALFRILDDLDSGELARLVRFMESATSRQVVNPSVAESAFLFWIVERHIAPDNHVTFDMALQHIGRQDLVDKFLSNRRYSMDKPGFCLIIQHQESFSADASLLSLMYRKMGFVVQVREFRCSLVPWKSELLRQDYTCYSCLLVCFLTDKYDPTSVQEYVRLPFLPHLSGKAQVFLFDHSVTFMDTLSPDSVGRDLMILWPSESLSKTTKIAGSSVLRDLFDIWRSGQIATWQLAVQTLNDRYKLTDSSRFIHHIDNLLYPMVFKN